MANSAGRNIWKSLDSNDFDTTKALKMLHAALFRPSIGRRKALTIWKQSKDADKTWCPATYWCHACDAGARGLGLATLHGPVCEWCTAPVEERLDQRRLNGFTYASAPSGSEFWTYDDWRWYDDTLEAYCDSITPDHE